MVSGFSVKALLNHFHFFFVCYKFWKEWDIWYFECIQKENYKMKISIKCPLLYIKFYGKVFSKCFLQNFKELRDTSCVLNLKVQILWTCLYNSLKI